jgi:hypothetical protein
VDFSNCHRPRLCEACTPVPTPIVTPDPTISPTPMPTPVTTFEPTPEPTFEPTPEPTAYPTPSPSPPCTPQVCDSDNGCNSRGPGGICYVNASCGDGWSCCC